MATTKGPDFATSKPAKEVENAYDSDAVSQTSAIPHCRWYHAGVHVTTVIVGTGVLGLPGAMAQLTWAFGIVLMALAYVASYYAAVLLARMHFTKDEGSTSPPKRLTTYFAIGEYVFGKRKAIWLIAPFQYIVLVGTCTAYLIAASTNIDDMYDSHCEDCGNVKLMVWTSAIAGLQLVLCFFPSLESIAGISIVASICSVGYCVIAVSLCFYVGKQPGVEYSSESDSTAASVFDIFTGLSTMAFAFGVHMIIPEIQATLRPSPSPEREFVKGVSVAWVVVLLLYFSSASAGYWAFGNTVKANILSSIAAVDSSSAVSVIVTVAEALVVVHVIIAYQVLAMPVYAVMERFVAHRNNRFVGENPRIARAALRFGLICFTWFIAILIPFFGDIMALFGAIGITPLGFIVPCAMYVQYQGRALSRVNRVACYAVMIAGTMVGVAGTISSIRQIALDASTFEVFS